MEALSAGSALTGLRMIAEGFKWLWRSRQAPWSAVSLTATMQPHILPWYAVRFWCVPEKAYAIELLSARTIRPGGLPLRRANRDAMLEMRPDTEARILRDLPWTIPEKAPMPVAFERWLFVDLKSLNGDVQVDFELKAQLLDNRRSEMPVWVRTNSLKISGT